MTDPATLGVVLAGGLARRMGGGDKALRVVSGRSILERTLARLGPQVSDIVLNANGDPARFAAFGRPVVPDSVPGHPGPLAGVLAGLEWAAARAPGVEWVLSVPGDSPFLPGDLAAQLQDERVRQGAVLACAASGGWTHPVVGLWPVSLAGDLRQAILGGMSKIDLFTRRYKLCVVEWSTTPVDPFFNANRPEDLVEAERLTAQSSAE